MFQLLTKESHFVLLFLSKYLCVQQHEQRKRFQNSIAWILPSFKYDVDINTLVTRKLLNDQLTTVTEGAFDHNILIKCNKYLSNKILVFKLSERNRQFNTNYIMFNDLWKLWKQAIIKFVWKCVVENKSSACLVRMGGYICTDAGVPG